MARKLTLKDGTKVPGSTTICNLLDKPYLVKWANKLGLDGVDSTEYVARTAKKGDNIHQLLEDYVLNKHSQLIEAYDTDELAECQMHVDLYKEWEKDHNIQPIWCEQAIVSETHKFGGFIDFYCIIDGKYTIVDFKTSKTITNEQLMQISSYVHLFKENNLKVDQAMIINVGKNPSDKFITKTLDVEQTNQYFKLFKALLEVYYTMKEIDYK